MSFTAGTRLGPYEILAAIGAGGMGEVYRARDTTLDRDVAIKVLPDAFATDSDRLERFRREARVLASLNHPNIAHLYGFEDAGSTHALVMELVDGPTLADRIAHGPIPLAEALPIARQIAEALEAAHEQGIVHRDLKPANVKVRDDGTVKVLDFGLAKALGPEGAGAAADPAYSSTLTARATGPGVILGTAAYMAPEQARGKVADKRADIWSFGVVLNEMLTGRRTFKGEGISDVLAAVLRQDIDWTALPAGTPPPLTRLLERCLDRDVRERLRDIGEARVEIAKIQAAALAPSGPSRPSAARTLPSAVAAALIAARRRIVWAVGWATAGAAATILAFLLVRPAFGPADTPTRRLSVLAPEGTLFWANPGDSAISPDGRMLAFTTGEFPSTRTAKLWVRSLDSLVARPLAGTEGGDLPFWSPDSRQLGFFADQKLKRIPVDSGNVEVLCPATDGRGGTWSDAGVIVFAEFLGPLFRVSENGGDRRAVTSLDATTGETAHRFPWFLPDGRHFLFAVLPAKEGKFDIFVGSLDAPAARPRLLSASSAPVYADPGYLLFSRKNDLVAQRFDPRRLQLSGEPIAFGDALGNVEAGHTSSRVVSVSRTGALAYLNYPVVNTRLVWLDRSGRALSTVATPPGRYDDISLASDSRRAAVDRVDPGLAESDIWIVDLEHGGATRFIDGPSRSTNSFPVWSPDGTRIVFTSNRNGPDDLFVKSVTGDAGEQLLFKSDAMFTLAESWSADQRFLVFQQSVKDGAGLWVLPMDGHQAPAPYLRSASSISGKGALSPDGRWMAYVSDETGRNEIYVGAFPRQTTNYRVTSEGAGSVWWRQDGKELMALGVDNRSVIVADARTAPEFHVGTFKVVATLPKGTVAMQPTPDFQRVLASVPADTGATTSLTVVLDWFAALKRK